MGRKDRKAVQKKEESGKTKQPVTEDECTSMRRRFEEGGRGAVDRSGPGPERTDFHDGRGPVGDCWRRKTLCDVRGGRRQTWIVVALQ